MNMIPINEVVEAWLEVRKEAHDGLDDWWREVMAHLRPTPEEEVSEVLCLGSVYFSSIGSDFAKAR
jgi:hypothetical protein